VIFKHRNDTDSETTSLQANTSLKVKQSNKTAET
jgi:hypothetical protein